MSRWTRNPLMFANVDKATHTSGETPQLLPEDTRNLKETLAHIDSLVSAGSYEEAHDRLLALRQEFPSSDDIRLRLDILDPLVRSVKLANEGKTAFNQGEYGEAVRALTQALELNPQNQDAQELKARALRERDRLRQVREALTAGQRAMRDGDANTAAIELRKVLQIDPAHLQATGLMGQIQNVQAEREREARFREAMQQADSLVTQTKFEDAQYTLLGLRQEFPDSKEIDQKLRSVDQQSKLYLLVTDGQQALDHGEFGEAVRIFTEAQQLAPNDERVRDMKVRAVQERDRLRQVREAIAGGQRALRLGESDVAEKQFQRALQLDPANAQATTLLSQLVSGRQAREREEKLKAGLSLAENLIAGKKFEEAGRQLAELQQAYPDSPGVASLADVLIQKKAEAAALPSIPAVVANPRHAIRPAPAADYARSMALAEELRQSLLKPRAPAPAAVAKGSGAASPPPPKDSRTSGSGSGPVAAAAPGSFGAAPGGETLVMGSGFRTNSAAPKPVSPPAVLPQPPAPAAVEPAAPLPPPAVPIAAPRPPVVVARPISPPVNSRSKMSPVVFVVLGVLTVVLAVIAFLIFRHP